MSLLAFRVSDSDRQSEGAFVVFATSEADAAADLIAARPGAVARVEREQGFDRYSPGPVPPKALIAAGWELSAEELAGVFRSISSEVADV